MPLSSRCVEILRRAKDLRDGDYVFPGLRVGNPLSHLSMLTAVRRLHSQATVHGFRSAFRDWASEQTNFPRDVCEMALAHRIPDKTEAAYRRGDLLEKRRELMAAWAMFALAKPAANVVPIGRRRVRPRATRCLTFNPHRRGWATARTPAATGPPRRPSPCGCSLRTCHG